MSKAAIDFVIQRAGCKGSELAVLLIMAHLSQDRFVPFRTSASRDTLKDACGLSEPQTREVLKSLHQQKKIGIWREHRGVIPTMWDILPLEGMSSLRLGGRSSSPIQQSKPTNIQHLVEETPSATPVVTPFPRDPVTYPKPFAQA